MSRTSRLLLAPAAALVLLAVAPGTAAADPATPDPLGTLRDLTGVVTDGPAGGLPAQPALPVPTARGATPGAELPGALQEAGAGLAAGLPGGGHTGSGTGSETGSNGTGSNGTGGAGAGTAGTGDGAGGGSTDEPAPDPVAGLCDQLRDGLGALAPQLATGIDQLCAAAEADPTTAVQDLLEQLLAALPTSLEEGCASLIGLIEQGGAALGVDPAPLRDLVEQLCALVPGAGPAPVRAPQPHPQPAQPVVHPQQAQPAVVPAAAGGPPGGGRLAYTGLDPKPYLFGGVAALGLGAGLQVLGRRRAA